MEHVRYNLRKTIRPFVNCIMTGVDISQNASLNLPIYADGYPGIMFQESKNDMYLFPKGKKLSKLFLYGQTLDPIALKTEGPFQLIVFQLYPFASQYLLDVNPRVLNDDCYNLIALDEVEAGNYVSRLSESPEMVDQIEIMSDLIEALLHSYQATDKNPVENAIHFIIENQGMISVKDICDTVFMTERTLERNFQSQIGLTPKQFSKIVQFQYALEKLSQNDVDKLTNVAFDTGFSDQSHFIRVFKSYTGLSPKAYLKKATA